MERLDRYDIERLGNALSLTLHEAAEVCFEWQGRNRHSFNRMFMVISEKNSGSFIHNHDSGQHLPMKNNFIYFMPCGRDLEFRFSRDVRFISFHFNMELFNSFDIFSEHTDCSCEIDKNKITPLLSKLINSPKLTLAHLCKIKAAVFESASGFITDRRDTAETFDLAAKKYQRLFEYIRTNADAKTSICELAEATGISKDSLSREFTRDCGITLKKYLIKSLIAKAEKLLLEPAASSRKTAAALKFNNEYYFSRFFKKHTGSTPGEYKNYQSSKF